MQLGESQASVRQQHGSVDLGQKNFVDELTAVFDAGIGGDTAISNEAPDISQSEAEPGKTYWLNKLLKGAETKGHVNMDFATTGKEGSLYEKVISLFNSPGNGVDDNSENDGPISTFSTFETRSQRANPLRRTTFINVHNASMTEHSLVTWWT